MWGQRGHCTPWNCYGAEMVPPIHQKLHQHGCKTIQPHPDFQCHDPPQYQNVFCSCFSALNKVLDVIPLLFKYVPLQPCISTVAPWSVSLPVDHWTCLLTLRLVNLLVLMCLWAWLPRVSIQKTFSSSNICT